MAIQNSNAVGSVKSKLDGNADLASVDRVAGRLQNYTNAALGAVGDASSRAMQTGQGVLNRVVPPEKQDAIRTKLHDFMLAHPMISAFILTNLVLSGIPLALFLLFTVMVFLFSVVTALVIGILAAVTFTLFATGLALLVLLPTIFFTTGIACFLFAWGLGGYLILRWANGDKNISQGNVSDKARNKLDQLSGTRDGPTTRLTIKDIKEPQE